MTQKEFDSTFRELLTEAGLIPDVKVVGPKHPGKCPTLLVGVSGGVDSMCLLHLLPHSSVPAKIIAGHCNFHLRGAESDGDEAFVREHCAANGVELCTVDFDTEGYARENGVSIETAARELRYRWFGKVCRERGYDAVVVAHNANDNAETLFLNLLRGTGLRGLCGMRPLSVVPVDGKIPLLRPLLEFTREEIEAYARENGIHWREDSTNAASDCRRNILRNDVFPLLATINPSFIRTLTRDMRYFTAADNLVESVVPDILRGGRIDTEDLLRHDHWRLFLFHLLQPFNFNSSVINDIADHIGEGDARGGNRIFLSPTHRLQITSRELLIAELTDDGKMEAYIYKVGTYKIEGGAIWELTAGTGEESNEVTGAELPTETTCPTTGRIIKVELLDGGDLTDLKAPRGVTYLDADKVGFPFVIRGWRHGDWFRPFGMNGATKKVSDLFVDLKYNMHDKESALFLTLPSGPSSPTSADRHILALLGERIDDSLKVTPATTKILKITL